MGKGKHGGGGGEKKSGDPDYVPPPDGGWGWVVVFSSFLIHVFADGIVYSFGVFLPYFVDYFNSGRGATSWVGSLQPAVTFTVGPLASALTNRYGCRIVTIMGSIICAAGFILSVFTPNLYFLYFSSGILAGLGFGLIYVPAIVSVSQYFEKRRSFATGLATCGSGFGTFMMAPITEQLLQEYSWRGAMLILGGVMLNVVVCGAVFRPLELSSSSASSSSTSSSTEDTEGDTSSKDAADKKALPEKEALLSPESNGGEKLKITGLYEMELRVDKPPEDLVTSTSTSPESPSRKQVAWLSNSHHNLTRSTPRDPVTSDIASMAKSDGALHRMKKNSHHQHAKRSLVPVASRPVGRKDAFYMGSLHNIPMFRAHHDKYITSITSINQIEEEEEEEQAKCCGVKVPTEFRDAFKEMMDFSLLKNPVFLMFAVSNFFTSIGFNMPFIFLPDRAMLAGVPETKAAWLLSSIGIANTISRVVFGFIADLKWVNRLMLYSTALTICGLATALSPFVGGNFELLITYAAVFGIFIGVYVALTSVMLVDLLGIDLLTNSFGLLLLFQGAATFIGPPLAGWMCDWTGSYDISFNVMGALIALSGAMLYLLPLVQRAYDRRASPEDRVHRKDMGVRGENSSSHDEEASAQLNRRKTSL